MQDGGDGGLIDLDDLLLGGGAADQQPGSNNAAPAAAAAVDDPFAELSFAGCSSSHADAAPAVAGDCGSNNAAGHAADGGSGPSSGAFGGPGSAEDPQQQLDGPAELSLLPVAERASQLGQLLQHHSAAQGEANASIR